MDIFKYSIYNGPNIGIYSKVNNEHVFIPNGFSSIKYKKLSEYLQTDVIITSVANSSLLGILMVVNNHGLLLPRTCSEEEVAILLYKSYLNV